MDFEAVLLPLGTDAANRNKYQEFSGYLLKLQNGKNYSSILLDCGNKYCASLDIVNPENLELIILSHHHLDHTLYLGLLVKRLRKWGRKKPLSIVCHDYTWKKIKWLILLLNFGIPSFIKHISIPIPMSKPYLRTRKKKATTNYSRVFNLNYQFSAENFVMKIKASPAIHTRGTLAYRLKIYVNSNSNRFLDLVYCPDTSFSSDHLIEFAKNTSYWLLDSTFRREYIDHEYTKFKENKRGGEISGHSCPYYSGKLCEKANASIYVIIHYFWERFAEKYKNTERNLMKRAQKSFSGALIVAKELEPILLKLKKEK